MQTVNLLKTHLTMRVTLSEIVCSGLNQNHGLNYYCAFQLHVKTSNQTKIQQQKSCDNTLCSLVRNVWRRRKKSKTGSDGDSRSLCFVWTSLLSSLSTQLHPDTEHVFHA
ncbi:hypothetical protein LDENG_00271560 [Lucifuga dentata]|nr:hypothetical protein LDENG_00271560 [Lucifuga dentata]